MCSQFFADKESAKNGSVNAENIPVYVAMMLAFLWNCNCQYIKSELPKDSGQGFLFRIAFRGTRH